ncbi:protein disulfide oxidoreductase [Vibrio maerlii]|uniref:protein disulfide oxidoreductase n=1 Tax=Vibrio maerlii TaxID=2231648 RepID=UPI000E3BEFF6|nr:protein disulfide oxidoreductase [Vibrio maerlii]
MSSKWKRRIREILFTLALITVLSFAMDVWRSQDMPQVELPEVQGFTTSGQVVDVITMSKEKPVLVYFWATWCPACKFVTPTVNWMSDSEHYSVVGIPISSGSDERVSRFLQAHDYQFENLNDPTGRISRQWGVSVTPTVVIVRNGEIHSATTGITTPPGLLARVWLAK